MIPQRTTGLSTAQQQVCTGVAGRAINVGTLLITNTLSSAAIVQFTDGPGGTVVLQLEIPGGGGGGIEDTGTSSAGKPCSDIRTSPGNGLYAKTTGPASLNIDARFGRL